MLLLHGNLETTLEQTLHQINVELIFFKLLFQHQECTFTLKLETAFQILCCDCPF